MARLTPLKTARAPWKWAFWGAACGLLVALVVFAPASWLASAVQAASGARVNLHEARGSVWHGSAQLTLTGGHGSADAVTLPGLLNWRIRPRWNGLAVQLTAPCCTLQPVDAQLAVHSWNHVALNVADHQSQWPASVLSGLGTPWNTIQPQGDLVVSTQGLNVQWLPGQAQFVGQLQMDANRVSSRLSTLVPMGSYRLTLQGGDSPTLQLNTLEGSLQLSGEGQWVGQRLRFTGTASAAPDRVEALSNLLNIVGRRDGARSIITLG